MPDYGLVGQVCPTIPKALVILRTLARRNPNKTPRHSGLDPESPARLVILQDPESDWLLCTCAYRLTHPHCVAVVRFVKFRMTKG